MQKKTDKHIGLTIWCGGIVILFAALVLLFNLIFHSVYGDVTADERYSLDERTVDFLKKNKEPVTVRLYMSKDLVGQNQSLGNYADYIRRLLEEYQHMSRNLIDLSVIEIMPFESTQISAEKMGIKAFETNNDKNYLYLGASFTNSTGKTLVIPKFVPERLPNVEDDITRILSVLLNDKAPVLGIISPFFNLFGENLVLGFAAEWPFIEQMKEFGYDVRHLSSSNPDISQDIDAVLVFYPLNLQMSAVYALDQYLLSGGRIVVVLDAFSENRFRDSIYYASYNSGMKDFLSNKGVEYADNLLAGDIINSRNLLFGGKTDKYPFWLELKAGKKQVLLNHSGFFKYLPQKEFVTKVLLETGDDSAIMSADAVIEANIENFDKNYQKTDTQYPVALLLEGNFSSIFDEAQVFDARDLKASKVFLGKSVQTGKLALIGDSDMFSASAWKNLPLSKRGRYETVFLSDNLHFLRDVLDVLTANSLSGADSKQIGIKGSSLSEKFYIYAMDNFSAEKKAEELKLDEIQQKITELEVLLSKAPVASVKQTKDLEQLRRQEIEVQENLRRIDYRMKELHKKLMLWISFLVIVILPLLSVFIVGAVYQWYCFLMSRKVKKYVEA